MQEVKRQFRIGQLAKNLSVESFVIRFWEKEFGVYSIRSKGGQRFYEQKDAEKFAQIKTLLYDQGFTIAGAKKILQKSKPCTVQTSRSAQLTHYTPLESEDIIGQLKQLRKQLCKFREILQK